MTDIIKTVPTGYDNALSVREIWRSLDVEVREDSVASDLCRLAEAGTIKHRRQQTMGTAFRFLYWREVSV